MAVSDIRYRHIGYIAINVSDLRCSREFYETKLGLQVDTDAEDGCLFLRCSDRHHDIVLHEGGEPGVKRIGWHMESAAALAAAREHLAGLGLAVVPVPPGEAARLGIGEAFRVSEPTTGATFEFYAEMSLAATAYTPTHTKIVRLGHIVLSSPDRAATERFLVEQLNFRVSDRIQGAVSFMRCFPNPLHHSFAVGQAPRAGLNHVNFMVTELEDIGKASNRMKRSEVPIVFGIGKHPPSESYFLYFLDPDGLTIEYSFGMEEFPEHGARLPREMPASIESLDYWGGLPDPRSGKTGVLEPLQRS